jgi:Tol biopolymer transport system component
LNNIFRIMNEKNIYLLFVLTAIKLFPLNIFAQAGNGMMERIFYCSFTPPASNIYISRDGGASIETFSNHPSLEYDAVISPDGEWVVFTSERNGIPQLYVKPVSSDEEPWLLIKSNSLQDQAVFSPDGKHLAFVGSHEGNAEIYLIPFKPDTLQDVSAASNLTNHPRSDLRPAFSPDGNRIAFSSDRAHPVKAHEIFSFARRRTGDIYTLDIRSLTTSRLTDNQKWDGSPVWSADGKKIYFYSEREGKSTIYQMNPDGSEQKKLFDAKEPSFSPVIAPNGGLIYVCQEDPGFTLKMFDSTQNATKPLMKDGPFHQLDLHIHNSSLLVFHGRGKFEELPEKGNFGFRGPILTHLPDTISFAGITAHWYGIRRAFVAAPSLSEPILYYDSTDAGSGFLDMFALPGYSLFLSPILGILFLIAGIFFAIHYRKQNTSGKFLLFGFIALTAGALGTVILFLMFAIIRLDVLPMRITMAVLTLILFVLIWFFYRKYKNAASPSSSRTLRFNYALLFSFLLILPLTFLIAPYHFFKDENYYYTVNYKTLEKKRLFKIDWEKDKMPMMGQILDNKISGDGKYLYHTQGFFTARAKDGGDIWQYDISTGKQSKISDSPFNDGFANVSENGKMVFRSGRSGFFDIFLKEGETVTNLTKDAHKDNFPAISLKGDKITFASDRLHANDSLKNMDIFLMELQADNSWSAPRKISSGNGQNGHPHFSSDGEWIIYTTDAFGIHDEEPLVSGLIFAPQLYGEIVAYHLATKERHRLSHNKWEEGAPMWVKGLPN